MGRPRKGPPHWHPPHPRRAATRLHRRLTCIPLSPKCGPDPGSTSLPVPWAWPGIALRQRVAPTGALALWNFPSGKSRSCPGRSEGVCRSHRWPLNRGQSLFTGIRSRRHVRKSIRTPLRRLRPADQAGRAVRGRREDRAARSPRRPAGGRRLAARRARFRQGGAGQGHRPGRDEIDHAGPAGREDRP